MTTELAVREDGEVVEHRAPMTLFGTDNPEAVVERASTVATALAKVIRERSLTSRISGKDHVQVEGWTLLGSMLGVFAEVEWSRPLEDGWESRAVVRTLDGRVVGAAEAMCTRRESSWSRRDEYALRSMAQTRAVSKALRLPLGFIMHLAGYSATPAEEVDDSPAPSAPAGRKAHTQAGPSSDDLKGEIATLLHDYSLPLRIAEEAADAVGVKKGQKATIAQLSAILDWIRERIETPFAERSGSAAATDAGVLPPAPASGNIDEIAAKAAEITGGEVIPPKPGTPDYKALPDALTKAKARAYWDQHPEPEPETLAEQLRVGA